jgi:DNA-binding protein H-NS
MARLSIQDQFAKLQDQKISIEKLEKEILDRDVKKSLAKITAVIYKAVALAYVVAELQSETNEHTPVKKRGRKPGKSKLAGKKIAPKYRNPNNKAETWTGRGRMPRWAAELYEIEKLESALIK